jgi:hypothetical protein
MLQGQKFVGNNGLQFSMFPMDVLNITQGMNGTHSHTGSYAIDCVGTTLLYPLYAPCDMECVVNTGTGEAVYTSLNPVNFPDGSIDLLSILLVHDNNDYLVGRIVLQGDHIANTGTRGNVTGDHIHIEVKKGVYQGMSQNIHGVYVVNGSSPLYDLLFIDDTQIIDDKGYQWVETGFVKGLPIWLL